MEEGLEVVVRENAGTEEPKVKFLFVAWDFGLRKEEGWKTPGSMAGRGRLGSGGLEFDGGG